MTPEIPRVFEDICGDVIVAYNITEARRFYEQYIRDEFREDLIALIHLTELTFDEQNDIKLRVYKYPESDEHTVTSVWNHVRFLGHGTIFKPPYLLATYDQRIDD